MDASEAMLERAAKALEQRLQVYEAAPATVGSIGWGAVTEEIVRTVLDAALPGWWAGFSREWAAPNLTVDPEVASESPMTEKYARRLVEHSLGYRTLVSRSVFAVRGPWVPVPKGSHGFEL